MNKSKRLLPLIAVLFAVGFSVVVPKPITALSIPGSGGVPADALGPDGPQLPADAAGAAAAQAFSGAQAEVSAPPNGVSASARIAVGAQTQDASRIAAPGDAKPADLEETIRQYIQALSDEKGFESWKQASWTSYPLGPGLHGWVVILSKNAAEVGYLVIHATADGKYELGEYGTGASPLFSLNTLYQSLIRQGLIPPATDYADFVASDFLRNARYYIDAFHAVWRLNRDGQVYLFDAKTGEQLPVTDEELATAGRETVEAAPSAVRMPDQVQTTRQKPPFDPYERILWMAEEPLRLEHFRSVKQALSEVERLTYVAEPFAGRIVKPLAATGFQEWKNSDPFLILDEEGPRYIPYSVAVRQGHFYR